MLAKSQLIEQFWTKLLIAIVVDWVLIKIKNKVNLNIAKMMELWPEMFILYQQNIELI